MWRITGEKVDQREDGRRDGVKDYLNVKELTNQKTRKCVKDRR